MTDMPMSPRMYATLIMERLREGGIDVPLTDKDGYTVQDIITDHIERAIIDATGVRVSLWARARRLRLAGHAVRPRAAPHRSSD